MTRSRVMLERRPSRVGTLSTREPSGAVFSSTLRLARSDTHAGSTGVSRGARTAAELSFWQQGSNSLSPVPFDAIGDHAREVWPRLLMLALDVEREESQMARAREVAGFHAGEALAALSSWAARDPDADVLAAEERVGTAQGPAKRQGSTAGPGRYARKLVTARREVAYPSDNQDRWIR